MLLNEINKVKPKVKNSYKAPEPVITVTGNVSIFLAGSIEMDKAEPWQEELTAKLLKEFNNITTVNPRRPDWDSSWKQELTDKNFYGQVDWEHKNIVDSDIVFIYFQPETKSPISLMELGLAAGLGKTILVCCPKGFWRKGNVDYICKKYNIPQVDSIDKVAGQLKKMNVNLKSG